MDVSGLHTSQDGYDVLNAWNALLIFGRGQRLAQEQQRAQGDSPGRDNSPPRRRRRIDRHRDAETQHVARARGSSARNSSPPLSEEESQTGGVQAQGSSHAGNSSPLPLEVCGSRTGGVRAQGRSPGQHSSSPQSVKERSVEDAMRDFVKDCSKSEISIQKSVTLTVARGNNLGMMRNESLVGFKTSGCSMVDIDIVRHERLHWDKRKAFHATTFPSATRILATGYLRKGGGHTRGFTDAVMARKTIDDAWFSSKNHGVVFELNVYGEVNNYMTASRYATQKGWSWEGWRDRFCSQYGRHMHRRNSGGSALYLNEDTVEIKAIYVKNSEDTVEFLDRARLNYIKPSRRRR